MAWGLQVNLIQFSLFTAVGTGAVTDMCACLKNCAKSDAENAYADLGDGHDIAGDISIVSLIFSFNDDEAAL